MPLSNITGEAAGLKKDASGAIINRLCHDAEYNEISRGE